MITSAFTTRLTTRLGVAAFCLGVLVHPCAMAEASSPGGAVTDDRIRALEERLSRLEAAATPGAPATEQKAKTTESSAVTDERLRALEERLNRLEAITPAVANTPTTNVASATATAAAAAVENSKANAAVQKEFQTDTESKDYSLLYQTSPYAQRVESILQNFVDIKGYFRAGFGRNNQGGPQVGFQAPGAFSKFRLGNEAENYAELTFAKNFYSSDAFKVGSASADAGSPVAHVQATVSAYNPFQEALDSKATDFGLPEAWGSIGNVLAGQPSVKFWAGNRFYRRHDVSVTDFFYSNMSGGGGGVEDIDIGLGKLAFAWIGAGATSGVSSVPNPTPANEAGFSKSNFDLRVYDIAMPGGKGEFGLTYARSSSGHDANGNTAPSSDGMSVMFVHTRSGVFSPDGINKASIQFGTGAAKTFTSGFETFSLNNGVYIRPDDVHSWRFRVTEQLIANVNDSFSVGPIFVYQLTDYKGSDGKVEWYSLGVRPIWHFSPYLSVAAEAGWDAVKDDAAHTNDSLFKFTFAPQVSLGGRFMSRPVIRFFVTYATWGDDFIGKVGGLDYATKNDGFTYGVQMEAWW